MFGWGGCTHAKTTNLHVKTLKKRKNHTKSGGGCRDSIGGSLPPLGGEQISLASRSSIYPAIKHHYDALLGLLARRVW